MKNILALCHKELLLLLRDRHGLLVMFAVPALFILIMSLALRDAFSEQARISLSIEVVNDDGGALSRDFIARLAQQPGVQLKAVEGSARLRLLPGFSELLATRAEFADDYQRDGKEPVLLELSQPPSGPPQLRGATALLVRQTLIAVQAGQLFADVSEDSGIKPAALNYLFDPQHLPLHQSFLGQGGVTPNAAQQAVPAWLIFALFFAVIPLASAFVTERAQGSYARLWAMGIGPVPQLAAKLLAYYLVNLLQIAVMLAIGVFVVPRLGGDALELGHSAAGLWLIGSATSLCALGLALLVAAAATTTTQATLAGGAVSLLLAAFGGVMVPKMVMPPAMQTLANYSPMSWALEGFWDLLLRGEGWRAVLPEAAALTLCGLLSLGLAALLLRRRP